MEFEKLDLDTQEFIKKNYYKVFNKEFSDYVYTPFFGINNRVDFLMFNERNKVADFVELTYGFNSDVDLYIKNLVFLPILGIGNLDLNYNPEGWTYIKKFVETSFISKIYKDYKLGKLADECLTTMMKVIFNYGNNIATPYFEGNKVYLKAINFDVNEDFELFKSDEAKASLFDQYWSFSFGFYIYEKESNNKVGVIYFRRINNDDQYDLDFGSYLINEYNCRYLESIFGNDIEFSYFVLNKYQRKGYCKDALTTLIAKLRNKEFKIKVLPNEGFSIHFEDTVLKVNDIYIKCGKSNIASQAVAKSLGFREFSSKPNNLTFILEREETK